MRCYWRACVSQRHFLDVNALPVGVNHGELCCVNGYESRCALLSHWFSNTLSHTEPIVVDHSVMMSRMCMNHGVLRWASGWASRCERCASGNESCSASLIASLEITVPVGVNHVALCSASGCESRCAMLSQCL